MDVDDAPETDENEADGSPAPSKLNDEELAKVIEEEVNEFLVSLISSHSAVVFLTLSFQAEGVPKDTVKDKGKGKEKASSSSPATDVSAIANNGKGSSIHFATIVTLLTLFSS